MAAVSPDPRAPEPRSPARRVLGIVAGVAVWPALMIGFGFAPRCMGFEDVTLRAIERCPLAVERLGTPVRESWLGLSCGNAETEGSFGHASWDFPVAGPRGRGSVSVIVEQRGGPWRLLSGSLETGDDVIDLVSCSLGGSLVVTPTTFDASVTSVIGAPGVAVGDACHVAVHPGDGPFPCRVAIDCAGTVLYGAGTTGWTACAAEPDGSLRVRDMAPTPDGGDPTLDLQLGLGTAVLTDETASGTWVVQLAFAPRR